MMISSYRSPKTKVKESPIHRRGLFAIKSIKKGELIAIKSGHIINNEMFNKYGSIIGKSYAQIADGFYLAPLTKQEYGRVMIFLNHSCDPSVGVLGNILLVAMRNVRVGEELTIDYALYEDNDSEMICNCKMKNCRKIITGKDWKKKELQRKYNGYFSAFIQKKIDHFK